LLYSEMRYFINHRYVNKSGLKRSEEIIIRLSYSAVLTKY